MDVKEEVSVLVSVKENENENGIKVNMSVRLMRILKIDKSMKAKRREMKRNEEVGARVSQSGDVASY